MRVEKANRMRFTTCGMMISKGTCKGKLSSVGNKTVKIGIDGSMFDA